MILSVINQKGGVGKTTSTFNLGAILAKGKRVLIIDLDPQGSLTIACGIDVINESMYDVMSEKKSMQNILIEVSANLFLAPANINLSIAELELVSKMSRENVLKKALEKINKNFDYILIDCPPSLSLLTINALVASDKALVTVSTDFLAIKGLELLIDTINKVKENLNESLCVLGVIATMYDKRTTHSKEVLSLLNNEYSVLGTIKQSVIVKDSVLANAPLIDFEPNHDTTKEYIKVAKEITNEK